MINTNRFSTISIHPIHSSDDRNVYGITDAIPSGIAMIVTCTESPMQLSVIVMIVTCTETPDAIPSLTFMIVSCTETPDALPSVIFMIVTCTESPEAVPTVTIECV